MSLPWSSKSLKGTPVSADELMILDSADANPSTTNKRITIGSLPPQETFTWTADHDAVGFELLNVGRITLSNPADTFQYLITSSAIALDVTVTLPLLTNSDTFVFENFPQPIINKTINENLNSIVQTAPTTGEYLRDNGTKFVASPIINTDLPTGIDPMKIALADGDILVGDAVNQASGVTMSGNATIDNTGVLTIVDNSITNAKTATFTTTKITTANKALLNSSIVYGDQNNVLGAFYEDLSEISTPASPSAGTRRIFVDDSTGEISVRTSSATTISLESPSPVITDVLIGTLDAPNNLYIDDGREFYGNDNGSSTLAINLPTAEPAGVNYTFAYTLVANDFSPGMQGLVFNSYGVHFTGQVINSDAVSSNVFFKFFVNDVEIDPGGTSTNVSAGNFGVLNAYNKQQTLQVGDIVQIKLWTDGSILVDFEVFGVYSVPFEIQCEARSVTLNWLEGENPDFIADVPLNVSVTQTNNTYFPFYEVGGFFGNTGFYTSDTARIILGEFMQDEPDFQVSIQNTSTNLVRVALTSNINSYRVVE